MGFGIWDLKPLLQAVLVVDVPLGDGAAPVLDAVGLGDRHGLCDWLLCLTAPEAGQGEAPGPIPSLTLPLPGGGLGGGTWHDTDAGGVEANAQVLRPVGGLVAGCHEPRQRGRFAGGEGGFLPGDVIFPATDVLLHGGPPVIGPQI